MAWLESHGNLARHPKTRRLMQRMGWTLPHTIGNLHLLWYWALEYAPTGDLTKFDPDQLTHDLDLGDATPEQFLQALIESGFMDEIGSGSTESRPDGKSRRLHDWPDYTAKSLRPKYRRDPEKWHDVLRSYGRPVITYSRRTSRSDEGARPPVSNSTRNHAFAPEQPVSTCAEREPEMVGLALRAGRRISTVGSAEDTTLITSTENAEASENAPNASLSSPVIAEEENVADAAYAPIPKCLSGRRNFNDWWAKLQEQYKNKGCPLTAYEQSEILAMLARNPFTAVDKLQYSVVNFETSYATFHLQPAGAGSGKRLENST